MATNVFEIFAKLGFDSTEYTRGLSAASSAFSGFGDIMQSGIGLISSGLDTMTQAAMGFISNIGELASVGDHIDKQSQKMNMSAKAYQEWDAIMQHSGTSVDSMRASMRILSSAIETDSAAFEALGLNIEELKNLNGEDLFATTITALQNVESDTQRTYLAGKLLGRGATELGALLNTSAEDTEKMRQRVHELGGVLSDDAVKAAAAFQDNLQDMKTAMSGMTRNIKAEFLSPFTMVMEGITNIFAGEEGGERKVEKGISNILAKLSQASDKLRPVIVRLGNAALSAFEDNIPRIAKRLSRLAGQIIVDVANNLPEILSTAGDVLYNVGSEIGGAILSTLPDWLSDDIKSIFGSVSDLIGNIDFGKLKDSLSGLGDSLEPLAEKLSGGIAWAFENVVKPFGEWLMNDALPPAIDILSAAFDNIKNALDILAPVGKAVWEEFLKPFFSILGDISYGTLKMVSEVFGSIADTFKDFDTIGFIDDIMQGNFAENWKAGIGDIAQSISDFGEKVDDFFSVNGVAQKWNEFWQSSGSLVHDAAEKICKAIEGMVEDIEIFIDAVSKLPSFASGYLDYLLGGQVKGDKTTVHHRGIDSNADGGYVTTPRLSWVAEKEPEYIIPESKMDKVFKGGGNTYNITVNMNGSGNTEEDARNLAELSIQQIRAIGGTGF